MNYFWKTAKHGPLILSVLTPIFIFITYGVAVVYKHVSPFWPYISDTGTKPPESCIFGLFLSSVAFLMYVVIYVRYLEVSAYAKVFPSVKITPFWNRVATCFGIISAFGLQLVANFQELNEFVTHIVGAMMCFFSATLYFFMQTIFTRIIEPEAKFMFWIRVVFTFLNVLFIVGTFAPVGAALKDFKGSNMLEWTELDGGFHYHLLSTFSEWLLVFSFCAYICTMHWNFMKIEIKPPKVKLSSVRKRGDEEEEGTNNNVRNNTKTLWI